MSISYYPAFAIYNRLTCDKAYRIMPEYAHEAMNVFVNDQFITGPCGSEIPFGNMWMMNERASELSFMSKIWKVLLENLKY